MDILTLNNVRKSFGEKEIIRDISFTVPEHCIYGFIGQNGAGKTTTMKMILGLMKYDGGEITVCGNKVNFGQNKTNQYIGYLPDVPEFYNFMTPKEYLLLCGDITGISKDVALNRADELLEMVGLADANKRIKGFSRGMKQRLGIAQALFNKPRLLICDEPTSALDPMGRKEILDILMKAKKETTVIFSTHILSDVERICDKVAFLHHGEIVLQGDLDEIKAGNRGTAVEIDFKDSREANIFAKKYPNAEKCNSLRLQYEKQTDKDMLDMMKYMSDNKICPERIERLEANLEDLFMEVVGK
ncbi:MAG: ABC transporter ATP-binding protein [Lachnospiraceae bacterium]|nr:ABC transporter ATP-binding protein [Lachnospiraceae bacterium]